MLKPSARSPKGQEMRLSSPKALALAPIQLPKSKLQDHVYDQLCTLILNGEIEPGQLVTIQALSNAFGVSAMPVREALLKLTGAKALTVISGRSIGIPPLTAKRLLDLTRVRVELEGVTAEWAVDHVSKPVIRELNELFKKMSVAEKNQDIKAYIRANREFHFTIYRLSGSDTAYSVIEGLWLQIAPYFHYLHELGSYTEANAQHRRILSALKAGDKLAVKQGIRTDIDMASRLLLSMLRKEGSEAGVA
jgi:DNA-binding GntR family transcriptional regulator